MKYATYIFTFLAFTSPVYADIVSKTSATANTGGIVVTSGSSESSSASSEIHTSVTSNNDGGTATVEIIKIENGVKTVERREEKIGAGSSVQISVGTTTNSRVNVSAPRETRVPRAETGTTVHIESNTKVPRVQISPSSSTSSFTVALPEPWLFRQVHEIVALFRGIFTVFSW